MSLISIFISFAIVIAPGLGIAVFLTNRQRRVNQTFLAASICMFLWLLCNLLIIHSTTELLAHRAITLAYAISACIPTAFQLLRLSIKYPDGSWLPILKDTRIQIAANLLTSAACFLPSFIESVYFPLNDGSLGLATPKYGFPYLIFNVYFILAIIAFAVCLHLDRRILKGTQRLELEFLGFACISGLMVGLSFGTIFALVIKTTASVPIAHAASVLTLASIVAYGISVHRILAVAVILRTITAYSLLSCYLILVYLGSWFIFSSLLRGLSIGTSLPSHIISTLIVVFSMAPVHGRFQKVADKLVSTQSMDVPSTMKKAGDIFQSVTTIDALLHRFSELIISSLGIDDIRILLAENEGYIQHYPKNIGTPETLSYTSIIPDLIRETKDPVSGETLVRLKQTPKIKEAITELKILNVSIASGFFSKHGLRGLVLFGYRRGGRVYDKNEQDALQILCNQFAVALENAQLYTEVQDSKIRNEIMLDQLVSGVIVANPDREITLFNHEAQRITGIAESEAIGQQIDILPRPIFRAIERALKVKSGTRNVDATLFSADEESESSSIRMGTTFLYGHDDKPMGALLVFTDLTELKSLEAQVRRTDQLSSVGTLAAGMAHEIKNPLVTIKTFTQLLPQRYSDEDFRNDFSSLVAHEVARIDGIVNELLSFSKPAKPHLVPMKFQETIEQTLKLTHEQMVQNDIALKNNWLAKSDQISGDAKLLSQALVNLYLNAIDAIGTNGTITVTTSNCSYRFANTEYPDKSVSKNCVRLQIGDTGKGIAESDLQKIFDPFFTLKSEGTGMGLSVAHGIIREHQGVIEVESELERGTAFIIYIPVLSEDLLI